MRSKFRYSTSVQSLQSGFIYMCSYLSKFEDDCSQAMIHAVKEALRHNLDNYQQMKPVTHSYVKKRECSI